MNHWVKESKPQRVAFSEIERKLEDCKMCTSDCEVLNLSNVTEEGIFDKVTGTRCTDTGSACTLNAILRQTTHQHPRTESICEREGGVAGV